MFKTVTLSDNQPCKVRVLGLFELDNIGAEILGPYSYSILTVTGQVIEDTYDLRALEEIPQPPDSDNPEPGTAEWKQLQEYETYLAALAHERKRLESYEDYQADIAGYILANCLEESDRVRVVEPEDWQAVYQAALVPQLTTEVIAQCLRDTFQSSFRGMGILDALMTISGGGHGKFWGIRLWEVQTIVNLGFTETAWCQLDLGERARKVCAFKLEGWLGILETEIEMQRIRAQSK